MLRSLIILLLLFPAVQAAEIRSPDDYFFQETLGDLGEELELARVQGKKGILLFFDMDECPFCHRMKATILNRSDVQDYFREHFLVFSIDTEGDTEVTDFDGETMLAKHFAFLKHRVRATPVFAFFDLQGRRVVRYTGAAKDAREFMWLGRYVVDRAYEKTNFTRYKRMQQKADREGQGG